MTTEVIEKIRVLMESDAFGKEIENVENKTELKNIFEKYGIDITEDEVVEICRGIAAKKNDELSEEDLDIVSGGGILSGLAIVAGAWAVSYVAGYVAGKVIKKKTGVCY